ncbi:MAG TPA: hypothetical protein VFS97_14525 [Nitrososphaeraceae archaeon]|nr:hypothetical protein [Nitrososphaeraceae archaeon]
MTTGSPYSNNYVIITFFASGKRNAETILCAYILPGTIFGALICRDKCGRLADASVYLAAGSVELRGISQV